MHNTALHTVQYISAVQCTTCMYSAATVQRATCMYSAGACAVCAVQCSTCTVYYMQCTVQCTTCMCTVCYMYSVQCSSMYSAVYYLHVCTVCYMYSVQCRSVCSPTDSRPPCTLQSLLPEDEQTSDIWSPVNYLGFYSKSDNLLMEILFICFSCLLLVQLF